MTIQTCPVGPKFQLHSHADFFQNQGRILGALGPPPPVTKGAPKEKKKGKERKRKGSERKRGGKRGKERKKEKDGLT